MTTLPPAPATPAVSVIVIFLDEGRFLAEALDSVVSQTSHDWELLLVDDGSTDASTGIAKDYAARYPDRVRYLEHEGHANRGMSASRNLAWQHVRGRYVAYLDGDDAWVPHKLMQQLALIEAHPEVAFVYGPLLHWRTWPGSPDAAGGDTLAGAGKTGVHPYANSVMQPPTLVEMFLADDYFIPAGILIRSEIYKEVGGYEDSFRGMREDAVFYVKVCLRYPVYVSSEVWYKYRIHEGSCNYQSWQRGDGAVTDRPYLEWCERHLNATGVTHPGVWKSLRRAQWLVAHPGVVRMRERVGKYLAPVHRVSRTIGSVRERMAVWPPVGLVRFGSMRRTTPIGRVWPNYRGLPIDRHYIEGFLEQHKTDVRGRTLEVLDATYTRRFGGSRVTQMDVLFAPVGEPGPDVTIIADLERGDGIPENVFDCVILTQTLLLIYNLQTAIAAIHRSLKPGGVLLVSVPGITPLVGDDEDLHGQYWSFTRHSVKRLLAEVFPPDQVEVTAYGNALTATAFLQGLATADLRPAELEPHDRDFELIITARAVKQA